MLSRLAKSPSKSVIILASAFVLGSLVHAVWEAPWGWSWQWLAFSAALAGASWAFPSGSAFRLLILSSAIVCLAFWRYEAALAALPPPIDRPSGSQRFRGVLAQPARQAIGSTVLTVSSVSRLDGSDWLSVPGRLRVRITPPETVPFGPELEWSCRLWEPNLDYTYPYYMEGVVGECGLRGPPAVIGGDEESVSPLVALRDRIRRQAARLWPEPESSFMLGLLLGDRDGIPKEMNDAFRETGTTHILAVSGYNISKVVGLAMVLSAGVRLRRRRAAVVAGAAVVAFSVMVGSQASVIRAAIMGGIGLLGIVWSRQSGGGGALFLAAAAMTGISPLALKHDLGFQLSFAAVWGLGAFGPKLAERMAFLPEALGIRQSAAETLAATLATVPFILYSFGRLPLIGPLVNLVILPFIPWSMMLGALSVAMGAVSQWLAWPFAWAGFAMLRFVEAVVAWSAGLGFWAIESEISLPVALLTGICLLVWAWGWGKGNPVGKRP